MKRFVIAFLSVIIAVSFASCANKSTQNEPTEQTTALSTTEASNIEKSEAETAATVIDTETEKSIYDNSLDEPSYEPQYHTCPACGGSMGQFVVTSVDANGIPFQEWIPCGTCGGSGVIYY